MHSPTAKNDRSSILETKIQYTVTFYSGFRVYPSMNHKAFQHTINTLKGKLYRLSFSILQQADEAADVVQEISIRVWKNWDEWQSLDNFEAWCYKLTRNLSIDKKRSKHYQSRQADLPVDLSEGQPTPHQLTENKDTLIYIQQLIATLPEQQRIVMHLRDIEELSYREIADMLDMTLPQVKTNLFRARQSMKEKISSAKLYEKRNH